MEFSEFIDVENMNFLDSPIPGSPINNNGKFMQSSTTPSSPLANYHLIMILLINYNSKRAATAGKDC